MTRRTDRLAILRGTLDVLVLQSISTGPKHGFAISLWIESRADGAFNLDDSALYQALHRLEARGFLLGEWRRSEHNRRARYYRLSATGRKHLSGERSRLVSYARALTNMLAPSGER